MRKLRLIALALTALFFAAACDVHELPYGEPRVDVTLHLSYDYDMPQYRTVEFTKAGDDTQYQTRYVVKLFKYTSEDYSHAASYEFIYYSSELDNLDRTVKFQCEPAHYRVEIWTDYVLANSTADLFYNPSDFSEVTLTSSYEGNNIRRDAFYGALEADLSTLLSTESTYEDTIHLARPLARYNLISTDKEQFLDYWVQQLAIRSGTMVKVDRSSLDLNKFRVRFVYPQYLPSAFNLHSDRPVDSRTGVKFDALMSVREDGDVDLGFDYVMVGGETEGKVIVSLELYDQDDTYISTISNIEVPLMRSHQTTVIGKILTSGISSGVSIDPTFDGEFVIQI